MVQVEHDGSVVHVDVRIHDEPHAFLCLDCGARWVSATLVPSAAS
jgi:hypothetical protein